MPGKIKIGILNARNLPIMDRSSESSDAFVEVRFGNENYDKTHVYKKSLNPEWNSKFVFEVEEDEIQEEPLQIRVLDHDTYSSHDAIGKVYIDLKPLLSQNGPNLLNGFFPIYDTLHGIRGEIKIQAKIEIINDCNEYRKSSSGVQFFASSKVPEGYSLQNFCGFVEEMVLNDDPEYQWIDKIRAPRTSNEARQKLFTKLSGEVQRRIGLKVLDMDANCVLGYQQYFDLEGEYGIVVRGIGTAAFINRNINILSNGNNYCTSPQFIQPSRPFPDLNSKPSKISPNRIIKKNHSDSDIISHYQINSAQFNQHSHHQQQKQETQANFSLLDKMEYPFFTLQQYPVGFIKSLCGIVCSRSVKLLGATNDLDELESRDKWWIEIRNEIRSHMKSLNCHAVLGYTETKSICEDVCVLSASGTAAIVNEAFFANSNLISNDSNLSKKCSICHVPYSDTDLPFPIALSNCSICGQAQVPDIIFTSIQPTSEIETIGKGSLLKAIVARPRKKCSGEISAKMISDYLPFLEYELHRQLLGKLKLKGMNMLYGLRIQISIGENVLVGIAEATACYAAALPSPIIPKIINENKSKRETKEIESLKKVLVEEMTKNVEFFGLAQDLKILPSNINSIQSENDSNDSRALFKIELDDYREKENIFLLMDSVGRKRSNFYLCSTEFMPGIQFDTNLQMFTSVYRCEASLVQINTKKFNEIFDDILESLSYKFRKYDNCVLANLSFDSSLYDDDHAMIIVTGSCLTYNEKHKDNKIKNNVEVTNLSYVPNATIENYLGLINLFLIRESTQIKENGGLSGFMHCFITEVLAMARAHVISLGGNALLSFKMTECMLLDNPHRNQGQCLINVSGDAVRIVKNFN
ncbi:unnamed protein product [Brachionus calyciflorus]|uniref:C2 domain-containing protein n=1 Tax=Brachionus calyciflorus TaxID=104777 RepID=A0A813YRN5_9BILA|nr:unnamed protein product [Brachionus calyciflorus]